MLDPIHIQDLWRPALEILILAVLIYFVFKFVRGTRGWPVVIGFVVVLLAWNAGHWPPLTSADGGWPAAQSAANRVEADAGGSAVAFVPLFAAKGSDAYLYPLTLDAVPIVASEKAAIVVVLCDTFWTDGCDGFAEEAWLAQSQLGSMLKIDRFHAAPDRILTVYRKVP